MQSGNVACPWALTRSPQNQALRFGKLVNCPTDNTTVLVQCLKKMDGKDVVKPHVTVMVSLSTASVIPRVCVNFLSGLAFPHDRNLVGDDKKMTHDHPVKTKFEITVSSSHSR